MRNVIGITGDREGNLYAACSDGTVWMTAEGLIEGTTDYGYGWVQVRHGPIPGTEADDAAATTYPRGEES